MSFDDLRYFGFLAVVVVLVAALPVGRPRLVLAIGASALFYFLLEESWLILPLVAVLAYAGGLLMARAPEGPVRTRGFVMSLVLTALPLLFFKYGPWLAGGAGDSVGWSTWRDLVLPVGLSFYTFVALGYLIDVFTGRVPAELDPLRFATFISLFPQLTAGPIERAGGLLPQLDRLGVFGASMTVRGLRAILLGAFMKIVIADSLAPYVNAVYADPVSFGAADLALATSYFSFQVYGDFAGYSLMAIGHNPNYYYSKYT